MWNISVRVLFLFVPVIFANVSNNDCDTTKYGKVAIHACEDNLVSGTAVAMDASKFSGSFCQCTLTISKKTSRDCVAVASVLHALNTQGIQFSVDNIIYTSTNKQLNFNNDSIRIVVEQTHTGDSELGTGNPCMIIRGRGCSLTLSCYNGTDNDPRQSEHNSFTANSEIEKTTTQLQPSTQPTLPDLTISRTVITTATKQPTTTTTDLVKVSTNNLDLSSTTLYDMETTISVIQAIHACQDSSFSGTAVAMDVSKVSGSSCECILTLTTSRKASMDYVALVDVIYATNTHRIQFSVDSITYTDTSMNKQHNFNGDSIRVVVEKTHTKDSVLGSPDKASCRLTLSCLNGTYKDPRQSGTDTVIIIVVVVVVTVVCTAIIVVLITCYCKRRKRSPIESDVKKIKPRKKDVYEVTENEMYVPMELLNQPSCTQGNPEPVYDQPDIDIIANHAHEHETKPLLQGQVASVNENKVKGTVEQSDGHDTDITAVANSEKNNQENQDHIPNEQKEELYAQVNKKK